MAANHGKLEGRITIPSGAQYLTCEDDAAGPSAVTLVAGDYYWSSEDSEATDMAAQLALAINTELGIGSKWYVTPDFTEGGTGKLNISCDGATCEVTWDDTTFRDLCGYDGDLTGDNGYESDNQVQFLWLPDGPPISPYGLSDEGDEEDDTTTAESPGGHVHAIYYQSKTVQTVEWQGISLAKARISGESVANASYQKFWQDAIRSSHAYATGTDLRVYPDADDDATYTTYRPSGDLQKPLLAQLYPGWIEQWVVTAPRLVKVP
jgi:hypothetical protein